MVLLDPHLRDKPELQPFRATTGAAGYDLRACISSPLALPSRQSKVVSTGIAIHIDRPDICGLLAPRSGLGINHGVVLANLVGIIDSDYTGEIKAGLWNRSDTDFVIKPYSRICQLLFIPIFCARLFATQAFDNTSERGAAGFGSTGMR